MGCWRKCKKNHSISGKLLLVLVMQEFVYPQDVAYPIGGRGNPQYVILEMHYDNPNEDTGNYYAQCHNNIRTMNQIKVLLKVYNNDFGISGVLDSSGIKFTYTVEPQKQRAGILSSGHAVQSGMIIPPGRHDYTITSLCPGECTKRVNRYHALQCGSNLK